MIRSPTVLTVADVRTSPALAARAAAFADVPVCAYAGAAWTAADGAVAGALSLLDPRPRAWTEADGAALDRLARIAGHLLDGWLARGGLAAAREQIAELGLHVAQAESAFGSMTEGVILQDRDSKILQHNASAARLLDLTESQLLGRTSMDPEWSLIGEDGAPLGVEQQPSMVVLRTGQPVDAFVLGVCLPEGGVRWLSINSRPIFLPGDATPFRTVTTFVDITGPRLQAERLQAALHAAEAGSRAKSDFLANVSHELRTPLNGMLAMASALARTPLSERQAEMVELLSTSAQALEQQVSDLLDLTKIEAGQQHLDCAPFNLAELLRAVARLFSPRAAEKGLTLEVTIPPEADRVWLGDEVKLKQVMGNLCSNAIKFTPAGQVAITAEMRPGADPGQVIARIAVRDTGIGLDADKIEAIFERFQQADASTTRRFGGTGLGLSISRALARLHGGDIEVVSRPGEGSTFTLSVPLTQSATAVAAATSGPPCEPAEAEARRRPLRILLAEDHPVNQRVVALLLEPLEASLVTVADGERCLEALADGPFDLVLMDMQMPGMDGLMAIEEIRRREAAAKVEPSRIVMFTANPSEALRADAAAAGADGFLTKPVTAASLYACLDAMCASA